MAASHHRVDTVPAALLNEPLKWFLAHHVRHRQMCRLIEHLAEIETLDTSLIREVIDYISEELPLHLEDEEQHLFPLLRRRCRKGDDLDAVLKVLMAEHVSDTHEASEVCSGLEDCLRSGSPPAKSPVRDCLRDFATHERRHLGLEDAIIIPIARLRLSAEDLAALSLAIGRRRGLVAAMKRS